MTLVLPALVLLSFSLAACSGNQNVQEPLVEVSPKTEVQLTTEKRTDVLLGVTGPSKTNFDEQFHRAKVNGFPEIRFGLLVVGHGSEKTKHIPIIKRDGEEIIFPEDIFFGFSFRIVVATEDGEKIFAILDHDIEGPAWSVELVCSEDGGVTWVHRTTIKKPYYLGESISIGFDENGNGKFVLRVDDYGQGNAGDYTYRSRDWGRSFGEPEYEPDILSPLQPSD